ncbi:MAG TPA: DUF4340 domain-containing protein [Burkholderiaceae bacterium]|jgi:hypothetical protein|nr:DUF4340 domain-containing protein [Burkholderiaceae bacterium]
MNARRLAPLALAALLVAAAAVWVSSRNRPERAADGSALLLASLSDTIDAVSEVRLTRGDGTVTTLQRRDNDWFVAQRNYPADVGKLRTLLINLAALHTVEEKTTDPGRYAQLNVEDANGPQAHSTRIDLAAGERKWSLLLGKPGEPNGSFVRLSGAAGALLVQPRIEADPQPARWIRTDLLDVAADRVQQVSVRPAEGPAYSLAREARGVADLTLHAVPPGRKPAAPAVVDAAAGALARLNAQDVKERAASALEHPNRASFRTFDGLLVDLDGYRDGEAAWIRVTAGVDPETARRFAPPPAPAGQAKPPEAATAKDAPAKGTEAKTPDPAAEAAAINSRLGAYDFQIPVYPYDQLYRQLKDLLAPPDHAGAAASKPSK